MLVDQLKNIKWDILGVCETRRKSALQANWNDGTFVALGAAEQPRSRGGIGFIVKSKWKKYIEEVDVEDPRVGYLILKISKNTTIRFIQLYAPTSASEDDDIEDFYELVDEVMARGKATYNIIMGDFNAKLGKRKDGERFIGPHRLHERNERGERMSSWVEANRLHVMNTWFKKRMGRRWTWRSPSGKTRNEIDYILVDTKRIICDVGTIGQKFDTGSDHRLLRARVKIDQQRERTALRISNARRHGTNLSPQHLEQLIDEEDWTIIENIDEDYNEFTQKLLRARQRAEAPAPNRDERRLSEETRQLMHRKQQIPRTPENQAELNTLNREIRIKVRRDREKYRMETLLEAANKKKSIKKARRTLSEYKQTIPAMMLADGSLTKSRRRIEDACSSYYTDLFKSKVDVQPRPITGVPQDSVPLILPSEVRAAGKGMAADKSPGPDRVSNEILKNGGHALHRALAERFNLYINTGCFPAAWKDSNTTLLFKKGKKEDFNNYRPICLLSSVYKTFTKILLNRITVTLDNEQPKEQAGFRSGFSTMDHIHSVNQLIERSREYRLPLVLLFIDFKKAFDSVECNAVWNAILEQGVEEEYASILMKLNQDFVTTIRLFERPLKIPVRKGVRQGDTISPKLFTACLEMVFRRLNWDMKGILIDGKHLHHLRFADDIVLIGRSPTEIEEMLRELDKEFKNVGLTMNRSKTQWMRNDHAPEGKVVIGHDEIEEVNSYVYLGQELTMRHENSRELARRIRAGWIAFKQNEELFWELTDAKIRADLFNSTVLPAMLYASETWTLTAKDIHKLQVAQRSMERRMLKVSRRDRIRNEDIRARTLVKDVTEEAARNKLRWAGHVSRLTDDRWTYATTFWYPRNAQRPRGRPPKRWRDSIQNLFGPAWPAIARDRVSWKRRCDQHHPQG
jgi:hypothetical protein